MTTRIGLVHALYDSIAPVQAAFERVWPDAETVHLYDGSLYCDYNRSKRITAEIARRVTTLIRFSADSGVDGILFTGSLFSEPVEAARVEMSIPVLTAYEAMIEAAFAAGTRLALLATVPDTIERMRDDIVRYAEARAIPFTLDAHLVAGAMTALQSGDRPRHDRLVAAAAKRLTDCDALLLAQHSMEPARQFIPVVPGRVILTSPETAARKLQALLTN